jgi:hypothetical protein
MKMIFLNNVNKKRLKWLGSYDANKSFLFKSKQQQIKKTEKELRFESWGHKKVCKAKTETEKYFTIVIPPFYKRRTSGQIKYNLSNMTSWNN